MPATSSRPFRGTGYGLSRFLDAAPYVRDVLESLESAGVRVEQIHPEYGPSQFEVSVGAQDPVSAADTNVLVKMVIAAVTARHGLRASFAPAVVSDHVGNGGHVHASFWQDGRNLLAGGPRRHGLTPLASRSWRACWGACLHCSPSARRRRRRTCACQPSRWAGAFQVWGRGEQGSGRQVRGREPGGSRRGQCRAQMLRPER